VPPVSEHVGLHHQWVRRCVDTFSETGQNHPTITTVEQGLDVLSRFAADFEYPSPYEGYHRILSVKPEDTRLNYTRSDIAAILQRVRDSSLIGSSGIPRPAQHWVGLNPAYRGITYRGYRGRRGGHSYPQYSQGRGGLNSASQYDRSNRSQRGRINMRGVGSGHEVSISKNCDTSSEIGGGGPGSTQDPFVVD
jgi:hypothetical protein